MLTTYQMLREMQKGSAASMNQGVTSRGSFCADAAYRWNGFANGATLVLALSAHSEPLSIQSLA